jgi:hypothetical protein
MNKLRTILSRYRLISSALALVFMLAALTLSPSPSSAFECHLGMICGQGCVNWSEASGCLDCEYCCACGDDYTCTNNHDRTCEYTY